MCEAYESVIVHAYFIYMNVWNLHTHTHTNSHTNIHIQSNTIQYNTKLLFICRAKGAEAAERARIVREYMQRKREAELNKARAHGDLFGVRIVF